MPEDQPKLRFVGRTFDEQAYSVQQFTIGQSILQRFGQQMTESERNYMIVSLRAFVVPESEPTGGVEPAPTRREPQPSAEHPTMVPPPSGPAQPPRKSK